MQSLLADSIIKHYYYMQEEDVWLDPAKHIVFVCGPFTQSGILKIYVSSRAPRGYAYAFDIRSTNKKNYLVSQPRGIIRKSPYIIYFYIKDKQTYTQLLQDRFMITITSKHNGEEVLCQKLSVLIQSANSKSNKPATVYNANYSNTNNFGSVFTAGGSNLRNTQMTTMLDPTSIAQSRMLIPQGNDQLQNRNKALLDKLKTELNDTTRAIDEKKRRIIVLQRQFRTKKATARFSKYLALFMMVIFFFLGLGMKTIDIPAKLNELSSIAKKEASKFY